MNDLAWGPMIVAKTWPMYFIGGFKFHTYAYSEDKKIVNSGVCVKDRGHGDNCCLKDNPRGGGGVVNWPFLDFYLLNFKTT